LLVVVLLVVAVAVSVWFVVAESEAEAEEADWPVVAAGRGWSLGIAAPVLLAVMRVRVPAAVLLE
jgi:hypothetical protein